MKKIYEMPAINVMRIETVGMVATSLTMDGDVEVSDEKDLLSRGIDFDSWDDED